MVVDMTDFEYQKENIVPLPQGRSATVLSALYAKDSNIHKSDESDLLTGKELRDIKRREFENELKDIDEVDDPLNTYFSYISWLQDNYPSGNDAETGLLAILETVLKKYQGDPRYLNDGRYLRLWFLYAHYSQEPVEIFKFLSVNDIGQNLSTYYEEYALYMETQNKYKEANEIYTLGINRKAQPIERLKKRYIEFQKRMILCVNKPADDIESPKHEHVKSNLLNMKSQNQTKRIPLQVKHVSSTATQFSDQNQNPNVGTGNNNTSFTIFEDKENPITDIKDELFGSHNDHQNPKEIFSSSEPRKITREGSLILPTADQTNEWAELGSHHLRRKENIKELESWNNVTLPQKASLITSRLSHGNYRSPVSFKIYEDPVEPEYSSPQTETPSKQVNIPKNNVIQNVSSNEKSKNVEVHRCLMNMIYSLSINNLYKEIIKEKERVLVRKRAGLRNERMNENFKKLDEKTFNKIKKNIDWSYDPHKNNYYNSFECKNISEFSIEEIRAKYYEKGHSKKNNMEEEQKEEKKNQQKQHQHHQSNVFDVDAYHSANHSHLIFSSITSPISNSVTNLSPHKKNKSISHSPSLTNSTSSTKSNDIISSYVHTNNPMEIHSHYLSSNDNKENEENEEDEETRYTVKQDLKIFIPHDLSSEKQHSTPSIPRTRLHVTSKTSSSIKKHSPYRSPLHHISHSKISSHKVTHLTPESAHISHHHYHHYSSSSTLSSSSKSNHSNSISGGTTAYEPHTPTPQKLSRFSTNSSTLTNSNTHSSLSTTADSESNIDLFARHESFHCKNSPTVTINTKNAFETVYSWFNEPCDNEAMDNLYIDNNQTNSDIDNTFILKDRQNKQKKHSP